MKQGWEIKKIKDICYKESSNIAQNKIVELDGDYPVYGASGFIQNVDFYQRDTNYIGVVKDGSGVGRVNIYPAFSSLLGTLQYILPKNGFHINYVAYALKSLNLSKYASGAAIPHIYFKDYGEEVIPVPPLPIQERIVSELDLLNGIIEKKREQLKELDALAQSIFYDMFGDPITNEKGWEVKKLGEVCDDITDGDHMPPPKSETGIPFLTISDIDKEKRELNFNDTFFVPQEYYDNLKENRRAKKGDVLYTVTGSYGIPVIVNTCKHFCFQRHIALLKPKQENLLSLFLCQWFLCEGVKFMADQVATGIAQKTVSLTSIRKFEIILPPLPLQHQFATKIEAIEKQKELIKQSISDTETLFNARMQHYFN